MNNTRIILLSALILIMSHFGHAASTFPEAEPTWKNVPVNGRPIAVFSLFRDSRGLMWVGTNSGLNFYDGVTTHPVEDETLTGIQIYSIIEKGDNLYLGTNNGLMIYRNDTNQVNVIENDQLKEIRCMSLIDNTLWIGSLYGIYTYEITSGDLEDASEGLPNRSVYSILRDSRGVLYAGTYNGIGRWDYTHRKFQSLKMRHAPDGALNLFANSMVESADGQCIYIGTEGSLYQYFPVTDSWGKMQELEGNNIKSLARTDNGHIFIGTDDGLFDLHNGHIRHFRHDSRQNVSLANNEIWCIESDPDNNIWAGHERGFSVASQSNSIHKIKLSTLIDTGEGNDIDNILRDSQGALWLGGRNGVIRIPRDTKPEWYRHSNTPHSLSHNRIRAFMEDNNGNIWLSTDGGLNRYNDTRREFDVFHVTDSNGNHNSNWVYAMIEDKDMFWIGGYLGGLHRVSKTKFNTAGGTIISDMSLTADSETRPGQKGVLSNNLINNVIRDHNGNIWILFFRDRTLTCYNSATDSMQKFDIYDLTGCYPSRICLDNKNRIWCTVNGGAVIISNDGTTETIRFAKPTEEEAVLAIGNVKDNMWISTQSNVWEIDGTTFQAVLLPIPQKSYSAVYYDQESQHVLLGGSDEILAVSPEKIKESSDYKSIRLVLADTGDRKPAHIIPENECDGLTLPYGGNVTFTVSTLDYTPAAVHRYMYRIGDSTDDKQADWVIMPEGSNTISLSDLRMGHYIITIGLVGYPDSYVHIPLSINAPLSLSWWAISIYAIVLLTIISIIIWSMRRRNRRMMQEEERKKTLDSVERKLTFLSDISHDLKTPLSMIIGPVSLMKEHATDPANKKALEKIYDNAVKLNNMIHRTIELNRLDDDDKSLLILSTFDVVDFCRNVFDTFKEGHPNKNFIFHSSWPQILIEGDAVKFESVITNLLSNACKYSEEEATISLGISKHDNTVEIVVSDDGLGIAEADQTLIFQRMFRASSTAKLREGTGIGLYLIKRYLELMHGNINLYSREGQGTSFVVTLPISDKEATQTHCHTDMDSNKPKILIVEDNSEIQAFIADILKSDYTVLTAANGRSGLSIAQSFLPDLIIADEMMPIMSGLEMCRHLKQIPRIASIPIIMLTAKSDNTTENESIRAGVDVFMSKPFEPAALIGRIHHLLRSRDAIKESVRIQTITQVKPIEAESATERQLAKIAKIIEDNIADPDLNVNMLCEKSGIQNKQLYRIIKKYIGIAPLDYIKRVRLQKAAMLLSQHRFTVSEICYMVGFKTPSYFAKCFQAQYGVKPSQYRSDDERGLGQTL